MITQTGLGVSLYSFTGSLSFAFAAFCAGILIDLDHIIDYYVNFGVTFNLRDIYIRVYERRLNKLFLLFHSLEFIIFLWFFVYALSLDNLWLAVTMGLTTHMAFDILGNPMRPISYFLMCRIVKGFNKNRLFKLNYLS